VTKFATAGVSPALSIHDIHFHCRVAVKGKPSLM